MARFDVFRNPNPRAVHDYLLDVQSDLVTTATRWCVPLKIPTAEPVMRRAQCMIDVLGVARVADTPNVLAVPLSVLGRPVSRLGGGDQALVEASLEFMLRGW